MITQMLRTTWDGLSTAQKNAEFLSNQARISGEFLELARTERAAIDAFRFLMEKQLY